MEEFFVEVAIPVALYDTFIYKVPSQFDFKDIIGRKVKVPFKSTKHYGIVLGVKSSENFKYQIKNVISVEEKIFTEEEIKILKEISDFYISPIGLTMDYFVPNKIKEKNIKDPFLGKIFYLIKYPESKNLTDKQSQLIKLFLENDYLSYEEIKNYGFDRKTLNSLIKKGYLEAKDAFISFKNFSSSCQESLGYGQLISLQNKIYLFDEFLPEKRLNYYLHLAKKLGGKGINIILPSLELCNLYYREFSKFFKTVYIYNDQLNAKKQWDIWKKAMEESGILIGTVSSMLLPLKDLKVLIVEEEDSKIYKTRRTPKFDVKRVAYFINKEKRIPVILSSSIPSIEAFLSLKRKQIVALSTKENFNIKNLKTIPHKNINQDLHKIKEIILSDSEVLVVSNKGYYSAILFCERCGWQANCIKCGFHLSVHYENGKKYLQCGKCKAKYEYVSKCPECDFKLSEEGFGKEKMENFLKKSLPESYWNKFKVISSIELKTLTIGKYQTVINVYPDFLLEFPDFRSWEIFFRKLILPLTVCKENYIVITNQEKAIDKLIENNKLKIKDFLEEELLRRKTLKLPPFIKIIKLEIFTNKINQYLIDDYVLNYFSNLNLIKKQIFENRLVYIFEYKKNEDKNIFKKFYIEMSKNRNVKVSIEVNPINF